MNHQHIESKDTIWKFHVNAEDSALYIECKRENNEFYLWEPIQNKEWSFPKLDSYVYSILQVQFPYAVVTYYHQDNLLNQSILMIYDLELEKEVWATSELKLYNCYNGVLQVFNPKREPKVFEYIDFKGTKLQEPELVELKMDVAHAERANGKHQLKFKNLEVSLNGNEDSYSKLLFTENGETIFEKDLNLIDYKFEYDYLLRIGNKLLVLLDKQSILIFQ